MSVFCKDFPVDTRIAVAYYEVDRVCLGDINPGLMQNGNGDWTVRSEMAPPAGWKPVYLWMSVSSVCPQSPQPE